MKAVVAAFNQEKALIGAFSVLTNLRMELFQALLSTLHTTSSDISVSQSQSQCPGGRGSTSGKHVQLPGAGSPLRSASLGTMRENLLGR